MIFSYILYDSKNLFILNSYQYSYYQVVDLIEALIMLEIALYRQPPFFIYTFLFFLNLCKSLLRLSPIILLKIDIIFLLCTLYIFNKGAILLCYNQTKLCLFGTLYTLRLRKCNFNWQ